MPKRRMTIDQKIAKISEKAPHAGRQASGGTVGPLPQSPVRLYRFKDLSLDTGQRRLWRGQDEIHLSRLSFDFLQALMEAAPNLLRHDQLAENVWGPGRVVTSENLSQRLMVLRRALGEEADQPQYIEVVRGQGYRMIPAETGRGVSVSRAESETLPIASELKGLMDGSADEEGIAATAPAHRRHWLPVSAVALLAGAVLGGILVATSTRTASPVSQPVSRFSITPPATAPLLASLDGRDVAISSDGRRIVFAAQSRARNSVTLYLRELDGLDARPIAGTKISGAQFGDMSPFISAAGEWVGFFANGAIWRVPAEGGTPLRISDDQGTFMGGAIGRDGTLIVASGCCLYRVPVETRGETLQLTMPWEGGEGEWLASAPTLLPDERAVLYQLSRRGREAQIAVLDLNTGEAKVLIEDANTPSYVSSGDVVFVRDGRLMAMRFDPDRLAVTGAAVPLIPGIRGSDFPIADYAVSVNGTLVYVPGAVANATSLPVWVDRSGDVIEPVIHEPVVNARDPRVSPDGSRILLTTGSMNDGDLWAFDLAGRPPILLDSEGDSRFGVWSPDGTQIAYVPVPRGIYTLPAQGSRLDPRPLRPAVVRGEPSVWTAENELLFHWQGSFYWPDKKTPDWDIIAMPVGEGSPRAIVSTENSEFDAALSPNGEWLAYASAPPPSLTTDIWVQKYPDGAPMRVSQGGGFEPIWSPDGRELYYISGSSMMAVPVEAGEDLSFGSSEELFNEPFFFAATPVIRSYDVAPDGRFLMIQPYSESDPEHLPRMVVVQNWREELETTVEVSRQPHLPGE
jgi:eukaryotic-like serine/threonine-protein kinase